MGRPVTYRRRFAALTRTVCQLVEKYDPTRRMQILGIAGIWSKKAPMVTLGGRMSAAT
jgi:hypothetical protein